MLQKYYFVFQLFGCGTYKWSFINFWLDLPVQCHFFFCKVKFPIYISCPGFKARRFTLQKNGRSVFNWKYSQNPSWYWGRSGVFQLLKYIFFLLLLSFSFFFLLGGRWRKVSNWVWTCSWEGKVWNREW